MSDINWNLVETIEQKAMLLNAVYEDEMDEIDGDLELEIYCREKINEHFSNVTDDEMEQILDEIFSYYLPLDNDEYDDEYDDDQLVYNDDNK